MSARDYDMIVIGSGAGGLTAAKSAAHWGARVCIVEKLDRYGGDCTWYGCVPSKALIRCSTAVHEAKHAARFGVTGIDPENVKCDWPKVQKHIMECQAHMHDHDDSPQVLQKLGVVTIVNRTASFVDQYTVKLEKTKKDLSDDENTNETRETLTADTFMLCTGAGPFSPPIKGLTDVPYLTYEDIFTIPEFPKSLMVVGGGPIGVELAQAFRRLGSEVTTIGKFLPREDDDVREVMRKVFEDDGIRVAPGTATSARRAANDSTSITVDVTDPKTKEVEAVTAKALLVASGRRPKGLAALNLDKAGVKWSPKGIEVDGKYRTSQSNIFAIGDCIAGGQQFTHLAGFQAGIATLIALVPAAAAGMAGVKEEEVPRATYTHPEVATVGFTETEAVAKFGQAKVHVLRKPLDEIDRAVCEGATEGFVKIIYNDSRVILGATIVANVAGEMVAELGLAARKGMLLKDIGLTCHAYPTWSFGIMQACIAVYYEDVRSASAFKCFTRCCSRRLKGNSALTSIELRDVRPH